MAAQFYCEKKVELQYIYGTIETKSKRLGTEAHLLLTKESGKVNRQCLWEKIYSSKPVFALEMFLLAKYGDLFLACKPDSVLFRNGYPLALFEYKFSKASIAFPSYYVQAQHISYYSIRWVLMWIVCFMQFYSWPKDQGNSEFRARQVISNRSKIAIHSIEGGKIYINRFNSVCAEMDLTWALEFGSKKREAKATNNPSKCDKCEYKFQCQQSGSN